MTNLVAIVTVAIVTNVTEKFPQHLVPISEPLPSGELYGAVHAIFRGEYRDVPNPKEKTVVTTCREVTTLRFQWHGNREVTTERVLWESNQIFKLDWNPK